MRDAQDMQIPSNATRFLSFAIFYHSTLPPSLLLANAQLPIQTLSDRLYCANTKPDNTHRYVRKITLRSILGKLGCLQCRTTEPQNESMLKFLRPRLWCCEAFVCRKIVRSLYKMRPHVRMIRVWVFVRGRHHGRFHTGYWRRSWRKPRW